MPFLSWLFSHSATPTVLAGGASLALIGAPILIHLINRLRYRRVRFAAMEFLLASQQRNRRRILIEQLILLLLRILIVAALILLIARLILDPNQLSMLTGAKTHHVVLLDDSGSMWDSWEEQDRGDVKRVTAFSKATDVVRKLAAEGERQVGTQQMTVLLLSRLDQPLFSQEDVDEAFLTRLKTKLDNLRSSHRSLELADGLDSARELLTEEMSGVRHLHVVSDFRKADWTEASVLRDSVEALDAADVSVNFVKTVPQRHANLGVTSLTGDLHVAAAGVPLRLMVTVRNFGETDAKQVPLTVTLDGQKIPGTFEIETIPAGQEADRPIDVFPREPGLHQVVVALPGDDYPQDDARHVAVDVPERHRVLIVDGSEDRFGSQYVQTALSPEESGFEPLVQSPDFLRRNSLEEFASIYVLNVAALEPDALKPLREFVRRGGGLAWFAGPRVQSDFYTTQLYGVRSPDDEPGLFPVPLEPGSRELRHDAGFDSGPDVVLTKHPIFASMFDGQTNPFSQIMRVDEYVAVDTDYAFVDEQGRPLEDEQGNAITWSADDNARGDGVNTIGKLRNGDPLFFEHTFGQGRIVTCLTSASPEWNNWTLSEGGPGFVIMLLEMQRRIARTDHVPESRIVGEPLRFSFDPSRYVAEASYETPDEDLGRQQLPLRYTRGDGAPVESEGESDGESDDGESDDGETASEDETANEEAASQDEAAAVRLVTTFGENGETDLPGVYRFGFPTQQSDVEHRWYAFNVPPEEGELALAADEEIRQRLGPDLDVRIQAPGNLEWLEGKEVGQDVRRGLLIALLVLLVLEQLLAWRLSYHPDRAPKLAGATR